MPNICPGSLVELDDGHHDCVYGRTLDGDFSVFFARGTLALVIEPSRGVNLQFPKWKVLIREQLVWVYDADVRMVG